LRETLEELLLLRKVERFVAAHDMLLALEERLYYEEDDQEADWVKKKMLCQPVKEVLECIRIRGKHFKYLIEQSHTVRWEESVDKKSLAALGAYNSPCLHVDRLRGGL